MPVAKSHNNFVFHELKSICHFALPIAFTQVCFMMMGVVDSIMLGQLGSTELAATGLARSFFWIVSAFCMGIISATDVINSQNFGAKSQQHFDLLAQGVKITVLISIFATTVLLLLSQNLDQFGSDQSLVEPASNYLYTVAYGVIFLLLFTMFQRYWQSRNVTYPILLIAVVGNIINYFLNRILIFGDFGFTPLGIYGAALSTNISRLLMFSCIFLVTFFVHKMNAKKYFSCLNIFSLKKVYAKKVLSLGFFSGIHQMFEVGVFSFATIIASQLGAVETAAHHVLIMIVALAFMFPLGLSNAAGFRVAHYVGQGEFLKAKSSGNISIAISTFAMLFFIFVFQFNNYFLLDFFTSDQSVIATAKSIGVFAIFFMLFDAIQTCAIGALRGVGNTKAASVASLIGYYPVGLLLGGILCFHFHLGILGIWIGLCSGISVITLLIIRAWLKHSKNPRSFIFTNADSISADSFANQV